MNRNLALITALGASLVLSPLAVAQAAAVAPAPVTVAPHAIDAKIALIDRKSVV